MMKSIGLNLTSLRDRFVVVVVVTPNWQLDGYGEFFTTQQQLARSRKTSPALSQSIYLALSLLNFLLRLLQCVCLAHSDDGSRMAEISLNWWLLKNVSTSLSRSGESANDSFAIFHCGPPK